MPIQHAVDQALLDAANKTFKAIFVEQMELGGEGELVQAAAMFTRSKAKTVEYDFLFDFAEMEEWASGERKIANFKARNYSVPNVRYALGITVDRVDIESEDLGLYEAKFRNLVDRHFVKRRQIMANLLLNGDASGNNGYDGVEFFSQSHPTEDGSGGTQSNLADANTPLTQDNFDAAWEAMAQLQNERGEPLDVMPNVIVVGPQNYATARDLFQVSTLSGGGQNPVFEAVRVIREPRITDLSWYLLDTTKVIKPFIVQEADALELQTLTDANDEFVIMKDGYFYGLRARYAIAYGFWQFAYKADGVTA